MKSQTSSKSLTYFYFLDQLLAKGADFAGYRQRRVTRTFEPVIKSRKLHTMTTDGSTTTTKISANK